MNTRFFFFASGLIAASVSAAPAPAEVAVTSPRQGDIHRFVSLPGTLRANQQVTLHAKVAGYLKSIAVDRGDTVKGGQLIAEIEMPEVVAERAKHEAELKIAKLESERMKSARAKAPDLITPAATDTAEARLAMAQAGLAANETLLRYSKISAPFNGVVTSRYVDPGAFVPAATAGSNPAAAAIVTIMDYSTVRGAPRSGWSAGGGHDRLARGTDVSRHRDAALGCVRRGDAFADCRSGPAECGRNAASRNVCDGENWR
jgi:multidrug efflux pump subunit AcrA (membrane-fusion protein)